MKNLNDPLMPNQERSHLLQLATDPELLKRHKEEAGQGNAMSFPSYWSVELSDFVDFCIAADETDSCFRLKTEDIKSLYHPQSSVLLFESDRRELGEWDDFYNRFAPYGYQGVFAVLVNGSFVDLDDGNRLIHYAPFPDESLHHYQGAKDLREEGRGFMCIGVLEVPLETLRPHEGKRVWQRTWMMSAHYESYLKYVFTDMKRNYSSIQDYLKKSHRKKKGFGS